MITNTCPLLPIHLNPGNNNCQDFFQLLWSQISSSPIPGPGAFGEEVPQLKDATQENTPGLFEESISLGDQQKTRESADDMDGITGVFHYVTD